MHARTSLKPAPPARRAEAPAPARGWRGRFRKRLGLEIRRLLPAWLFFFLAFSLLRLTQTAVLEEFGVRAFPPSKVFAGALIVAKALLTVDRAKLFARLEGRPLLVAALVKSFAYMLVVFLFEYSEALFEHRQEGFTAGNAEFAQRLASLRFWVIQVWLVLLLFLFSATRTLRERLGDRRFRRLFFGR